MSAVIVDYRLRLKCVSNFLYVTGRARGHPNVAGPEVNYTLTLQFDGSVNNALINALKKLTQCVNALKKLTLRQL